MSDQRLQRFYTELDKDFLSLIEVINQKGFRVGVVGGAVRDFFLGVKSQKGLADYDCELRAESLELDLEDLFENLTLSLGEKYETERLPYNIVRVKTESFTAELSLPRVETYLDSFSHSNFSAEFIDDTDYSRGFLRRDLTINALMIEIFKQEVKLIDPLNGLEDLDNAKLKPCSKTFRNDPVRFLRVLSFKLRLSKQTQREFQISQEIRTLFKEVSITDFSPHYLFLEMMKSQRPLSFIKKLLVLMTGNEPIYEFGDDFEIAFDNFWLKEERRSLLKNIYFIDDEVKFSLLEALGFKDVKNQATGKMPWKLKTEKVDTLWVARFKLLSNLSAELVEIYSRFNLVDLNIAAINTIKSIDVDLGRTPPSERSIYLYSSKMRKYLET